MRELAGDISALRQALLIGYTNRLAFRMQRNNGYKTVGQRPVLAQLHPCTSRITADEDGLLPEWVIYNELIATQRPFLSKVCHGLRAACGSEFDCQLSALRLEKHSLEEWAHFCLAPVSYDFVGRTRLQSV